LIIYFKEEKHMQNYISFAKQSLYESIQEMSTVPWLFVKNPEGDFSRKRKMDYKWIIPSRI
jgi:hypothetical protein